MSNVHNHRSSAVSPHRSTPAPQAQANLKVDPHPLPVLRYNPGYVSGFDPATGDPGSVAQAEYNLRGKTDAALQDAVKFLEARIKDASSGKDANPSAVKRAQERLALVKSEIATRKKLGNSDAADVRQLDNADLQKRIDKLSDPKTGEIAKIEAQLKRFGPPPYPNTEISKGVAELKKKLGELKGDLSTLTAEKKARAAEAEKGGKLTSIERTRPVTPGQLEALKEELRTAPDSDLDAYVKKLEAQKKDAAGGAFQDQTLTSNLDAKLAAAKAEQRLREGWKNDGTIGKFARTVHGKSTPEIRTLREQIAQRLAEDTGGEVRNPARAATERAQLAAIDAELKRRGIQPPAGTTPTPPASGDLSQLTDDQLKAKYDSAWQIVYGESFAAWPPEVVAQAKQDLTALSAEMSRRGISPGHLAA